MLLLAAVLFVVIVGSAASRWGLFGKAHVARGLEGIARKQGYVLNDAGDGLTAEVDGVAIEVSVRIVPSHGGPLTVCTLHGNAREPARGRIAMHPKHEDQAPLMRIGHVDLDTCFRIDASSRDLAYDLFDDESRQALLAFGPRGALLYVDGAVSFEWELHDFVSAEDIDAAVRLVHALCRARHAGTPYRA
jgi:hypothetical protein